MFLTQTFAPTFVDALGMNTPKGGGGRIGARTWLTLAFVLFVAVWLFFRVNHYFR